MKPRTKLEFEVTDLSKSLLSYKEEIKQMAYDNISRLAFHTTKKYWCSICENSDSLSNLKANNYKCACGETLDLYQTRNRKWSESFYLGIAHVVGDFQIIRHFLVEISSRKDWRVELNIDENIQHFIKNDKTTIISRNNNNMNASTPRYGEMSIKKPSYYRKYCYYPTIYKYHKSSIFTNDLMMRGVSHLMTNTSFEDVANVISNPASETIIKSQRFDLFEFCQSNFGTINRFWKTVKLAIKNQYYPEDVKMWFDHLALLSSLNKDLLSPKYIFPLDLKSDHEKLVIRKRKIDSLREAETKRIQAKYDQEKYIEDKSRFFGLRFQEENISIKVLENVEEFIEQGDLFKHCVFTNEYYKKENSLILSAFHNNTPIETIEVSLKNFNIVQSRGLGNKASEHNSDIISLLSKNINAIKDRVIQKAI
ncbi:PcfJ domain-containing protein [Sphingobacterium hungaricum]|uniref:PcfJ-like protein n=1 Tax=Sphingobacterium hungaricum TaxID=2082723 RepID=A0A928UWQ3_9SPHI|nr:PcfJ domain-containing protein [Sphingobacterium hungaricum]MBE8712509.1 hypothetical protein [Sphingobacterium hungaricum]